MGHLQLEVILGAFYYAYPVVVFGYLILCLALTLCTNRTQKLRIKDEHVRCDLIIGLVAAIAGFYLVEVVTRIVQFFASNIDPLQSLMVYLVASILVFGAEALALTDSKFPIWFPFYGTWLIGLVFEASFLAASVAFFPPKSYVEWTLVVVKSLRVCLFIVTPVCYFGLRIDKKSYKDLEAEQQSLLHDQLGNKPGSEATASNANGYGTTTKAKAPAPKPAAKLDIWAKRSDKIREDMAKRLEQDGNWFTYAKSFVIFFPYIWPVHDRLLQFRAVLVGCCLLAKNALNLLVPLSLGYMVRCLALYAGGDKTKGIWHAVFLYATLGFVSGGACIGWLRDWLWRPIEQYSYNAVSTAAHAHVMSLSSEFHEGKSSSEIGQAIGGGHSVFSLVESVLFKIVPMFIDLAVAFWYLSVVFGPFMGLIMIVFVATYLYITTKIYTLQGAEKRREYVLNNRNEWNVMYSSISGWDTASLFNMLPHEERRYGDAVKEQLKSSWDYEMALGVLSAVQAFIMTVGKVAALCLGVWRISYGENDVGDFTTLIIYWSSLESPVIFFGTTYRSISSSLMDAERLLQLLKTKPTIVNKPAAKPLKFDEGVVKFDDVCFAYDERKPTLKNVTFTAPAGKTIALVGETGGGKSTVLKLIDRFYDIKGGVISIDGQDIRDVTLRSLRENIGVVPQDPMLFHETVMNNIRYARMSATDEEVHEACKAAAVHDKIMSFPDGYEATVGENGVKLSGGEKQRIAIARAILKRPNIILLDEATSAVDTATEQIIQQGLTNLCRGRTTIIVAHRLSTIMRADIILVVMNGKIVEQGSHESLVTAGGKYHDLWTSQLFVKPIVDKDAKVEDKDIINDITDSKTTITLAQALGKAAPATEEDKKGTSSKTGGKETPLPEAEQEDETPFSKKLETSKKIDTETSHGPATGATAKEVPDKKGEETPVSGIAPRAVTPQADIPPRSSSAKGHVHGKDSDKHHKKLDREEQKQKDKERRAASWTRKLGRRTASKNIDNGKGGVAGTDGADDDIDDATRGVDGLEEIVDGEPKSKKRKSIEELSVEQRSVDAQQSEQPALGQSNESEPLGSAAVEGHPVKILKSKRTRYARRAASRSEPVGKAPDFSVDGAADARKISGSSVNGEGSMSSMALPYNEVRRVSAPGEPRSGQQERANMGRKNRRNWKLKNGAGAGTSRGLSSAGGVASEDVVRSGVSSSMGAE